MIWLLLPSSIAASQVLATIIFHLHNCNSLHPDWSSCYRLSPIIYSLGSSQRNHVTNKSNHASIPTLLSIFHWLPIALDQNPDPSPWPADPVGSAPAFFWAVIPLPLPVAPTLVTLAFFLFSKEQPSFCCRTLYMIFLHTFEWMTSNDSYFSLTFFLREAVPIYTGPVLLSHRILSSSWHRPTIWNYPEVFL